MDLSWKIPGFAKLSLKFTVCTQMPVKVNQVFVFLNITSSTSGSKCYKTICEQI